MALKNFILNKKALFITSSFILITSALYHVKKEGEVKIVTETDEYFIGEYPNGLIIFGDEKFLENYSDEEYIIKILDDRNSTDPNIKIYNSYKVINPVLRKNIIESLLEHEGKTNTLWDRSQISMENEWFIHNMSYYANYRIDHSTDVDLNNEDEYKYLLKK